MPSALSSRSPCPASCWQSCPRSRSRSREHPAFAQAGCQPTLTQPCAKTPNKPGNQPSQRTNAARADDTNEPVDHSARIKVDRDTEFKFGTGGIGLGRKF